MEEGGALLLCGQPRLVLLRVEFQIKPGVPPSFLGILKMPNLPPRLLLSLSRFLEKKSPLDPKSRLPNRPVRYVAQLVETVRVSREFPQKSPLKSRALIPERLV